MNSRIIGKYRVVKDLGVGGQASVHLAEDIDIPSHRVVLKVLKDPLQKQRLRGEANKLAQLEGHPHICQIKHFFAHEDGLVIAMEFVDGPTLKDLVPPNQPLQLDRALEIIDQVLDTLVFAHELNIYHRDIKPHNLMLDKQGHVKVIDFGLAKGKGDPEITEVGQTLGTIRYMAPEQFGGGDLVDGSSKDLNDYTKIDIYQTGVTLYYLLTGCFPYEETTLAELIHAKVNKDAVDPRQHVKSLPPYVAAAIMTALSRREEDRFSSAKEMKAALLGPVSGPPRERREPSPPEDVPEPEPEPEPEPAPEPEPTRPRRRLTPLLIRSLMAVVVLVGLIALGSFLLRENLAVPELTQPGPMDSLALDGFEFRWRGQVGFNGRYIVEISANSEFRSKEVSQKTDREAWVPGHLLPGNTYYWRVGTVDKKGSVRNYTPTRAFFLAPKVARATLRVVVAGGGEVYVDGKGRGWTDEEGTFELDAGSHEIAVENSTSIERRLSRTVELASGIEQLERFDFSFETKRTESPREEKQGASQEDEAKSSQVPIEEQFGAVRVAALDYARASILIDNVLMNQRTTHTFDQMPVGRHRVTVRGGDAASNLEQSQVVEVRANTLTMVKFTLLAPDRPAEVEFRKLQD